MSDVVEKAAHQRDFDDAAACWDDEPRRVRLATEVADTVKREVALDRTMDVLDFGCGTGLVTLAIQPLVRSITGADSSAGMLNKLRGKVAALGLENVATVLIGPERDALPRERFNLLISSMTLHHVEDVAAVLQDFYRALVPGGVVAVADLDAEDGSFHRHDISASHYGFDRGRMRAMLEEAGFHGVQDVTAAKIEKKADNGSMQTYSVFLVMARK